MNRLGKPYCDLARVSVEDAAKSRVDGALERYCRLGALDCNQVIVRELEAGCGSRRNMGGPDDDGKRMP